MKRQKNDIKTRGEKKNFFRRKKTMDVNMEAVVQASELTAEPWIDKPRQKQSTKMMWWQSGTTAGHKA
jgi:hypothetical protein